MTVMPDVDNLWITFRRPMKKLFIVIALLISFIASTGVALADSPHFISASASRSGPSLLVSFKESGLGDTSLTNYLVQADGNAVYECLNNGDNVPKSKQAVSQLLVASASFSPQNGTVAQSVMLAPPGPGSFSCPSGQHMLLVSDSFMGVSVSDVSNGVSIEVPGAF